MVGLCVRLFGVGGGAAVAVSCFLCRDRVAQFTHAFLCFFGPAPHKHVVHTAAAVFCMYHTEYVAASIDGAPTEYDGTKPLFDVYVTLIGLCRSRRQGSPRAKR